jgi:hypothetical protein
MADMEFSALEHAFGKATDVPAKLRGLSSADAGVREASLDALYSCLWHQGRLYPATPHAIPHVLALLAEDTTPERALLMLFLADLGRSSTFGDDPWYAETASALSAGVEILDRRLSSSDEVERIAATVALAWADDGMVLARRICAGDQGERLVTTYALAAGRAPPPEDVLERYVNATEPAVRLAARIGLVRAGRPGVLGTIDAEAYTVLAEVVGTVAPQALPQPVELLDPATVDPSSIVALSRVLSVATSHREALPLVEFLLSAVLPDGYEEPPDPLQEHVLTAIGASAGAWVYGTGTLAMLLEHGLEAQDRTDFCTRMGLDLPERLEREDTEALLAGGEATGIRYEEMSRTERDLLERFVDTLDAMGWNETRHWHDFVISGSGLDISPIGVGRHFNERAVLELTLWLFDEHVAADTGERVGEPYVRLLLTDMAELKDPIGIRAYVGDRLLDVLTLIDRHRPTLDRDNFHVQFLLDLFAIVPKIEMELADGRVLEIQPRQT